jgi:site-specific DNA recombinase
MPRLHPKLAEVYRQRLEEVLNDSTIRPEATDALRALIDRIVLYPGERRGELRAELHGELGAILALSQGGGKINRTPAAGVRFSVVAGTRNRHYLLFRAEGLPVADLAYRKVKSP